MKTKATYYALPGLPVVPSIFKEVPDHEVVNTICFKYEVCPSELRGYSKKPGLVFIRHLTMFLLRKQSRLTLSHIGWLFDRDHTTVIHAVRAIEDYLITDSFGKRAEIISLL